jgi:hypothetical protein
MVRTCPHLWTRGDASRVGHLAAGEAPTLTRGVAEDGRLREAMLERWGNQTGSGECTRIPFEMSIDEESTFGGYTIP